MAYINTGSELINSIKYSLRREYTGYIDTTRLLAFINEIALEVTVSIILNSPDKALMTNYSKLRVSTDGFSKYGATVLKPLPKDGIYLDGVRYMIPSFSYGDDGVTTIDSIDYPNIIKIAENGISYVNTKEESGLVSGHVDQIKLISFNEYQISSNRYYRKSDDDTMYAFVIIENESTYLFVSRNSERTIMLTYYRYPREIANSTAATDYTEKQLDDIKNVVVVKFLERIKDERFKDFISQNNK